jgi:hypothetical protein
MKKLIVVLIFALLCAIGKSQAYLGSDIYFKQICGLYSSPYTGWCAYSSMGKRYVQDDSFYKFKIGIGRRIVQEKQRGYVSLGMAYNHRWGNEDQIENLKLYKLDMDIIASLRIVKRTWFIFSTDLLNWDFMFGIGYDFTTKQRIYNRRYKLLR